MTPNRNDEMSLEKELARYDDSFPKEPPTWDEDAIVTPRAFTSEYGYDLNAERIPSNLGPYLLNEVNTNSVLTLVRTFGNRESFERKDPCQIRSMIQMGGYNMVELYRLDGSGDVPLPDAYARGGFLAVYFYSRGEEKRKENGHDSSGYYALNGDGLSELISKLLCGPDEGPWDGAPDDRFSRDWKKKPNPAGRESWAVAALQDRQLNKPLAELAAGHLLNDELRITDEGGPFQTSKS